MAATRLVIGIACWLILCSPSHAAPADQNDAPPLFDNLGSLHHPITTTSEQAQRYFDQGLRRPPDGACWGCRGRCTNPEAARR